MRFRVGIVLCFLAAYTTVGCREALRPSTENNLAPETWITAAPLDTITVERGVEPRPTFIPVRFHVHWAGSDADGAVAGYFWAVVETLPSPPEGFTEVPSLPGPKAADYHYTTRTDSAFIFTVAEGFGDRQHAFFIYAVDNKGRPDPTPARFIFTARDRFPPIPHIEAVAEGLIYQIDPITGEITTRPDIKPITDQNRPLTSPIPRDTVASNARLTFRVWATPRIAGSVIEHLRYKLDAPDFAEILPLPNPPEAVVVFNSGVGADTFPPAPGVKVFTLRAVDQAKGSEDSTRRFVMNYSPTTWWSGPDPNDPRWRTHPLTGDKFVTLAEVMAQGAPASLLGPDSTQIFPARRPNRRTFLEFYADTFYVRSEFDTVHMNSIVIIHNGGFDPDSPYLVRVTPIASTLPGFPGGPILVQSLRPNASPVAFRSQMSVDATPLSSGIVISFSELPPYPVFDPNDPAELSRIAGYWPEFAAGTVYLVSRAVDGDGSRDRRIGDGSVVRGIVSAVDGGGGTAEQRALRDGILVFYVDKPPFFLTQNASFSPRPGQVFTDLNWALVLPAADIDPFLKTLGTKSGNRSPVTTLRRKIKLRGKDVNGADIVYSDNLAYLNTDFVNFLITVPLAAGPCTLEIELCDCAECEVTPGQGRCITLVVPVVYAPPGASLTTSTDRPGRN